jgi:hypothetical protein
MNTFRLDARAGLAAVALVSLAGTASAHDLDIPSYIVGVDNLPTIASGTFAGMANPNYNRLTFLFAHTYPVTPASNHYHSKGVYRYDPASSAESPLIQVNPSNYVPEGANPPITLSIGTGDYSGKLVSNPLDPSDAGYAFSFMTIADVDSLRGFGSGSPEDILLNSSSGRWSASIAGADVHVELVFLSDGLNVGVGSDLNAFVNPGDDHHLADSFSFTPTFWTEFDAAPGTYIAQFKLTDENGTFGDSGTFEYRFAVAASSIPEPSSTAALAGFAILGLAVARRRRRA